jgi:pimeloyl-ACP methyl ester carboxylesterase
MFRNMIPGADLVVLPNAAHIPTVEQPSAVLAAMTRFLAATLDPR